VGGLFVNAFWQWSIESHVIFVRVACYLQSLYDNQNYSTDYFTGEMTLSGCEYSHDSPESSLPNTPSSNGRLSPSFSREKKSPLSAGLGYGKHIISPINKRGAAPDRSSAGKNHPVSPSKLARHKRVLSDVIEESQSLLMRSLANSKTPSMRVVGESIHELG
jgi:hypothetical protein